MLTMALTYQLLHKGQLVGLVVNKSMACAVVSAYNGVTNDDWELHDIYGNKVPKLFGKGPMSEHYGRANPEGGTAKVSWGPEGW